MVQKQTSEDWDFNIPFTTRAREVGGGGTPYNGQYEEAPPEGVPLSGFRYIQG